MIIGAAGGLLSYLTVESSGTVTEIRSPASADDTTATANIPIDVTITASMRIGNHRIMITIYPLIPSTIGGGV